MRYKPVVGLEVHAELQTKSKIFCGCRVVNSTEAEPNRFICPVCTGMPGTLPVINKRAVDFGIMVALALNCDVNPISIFARKNYFYPDLPKGYQISQYATPLAIKGSLQIDSLNGKRMVRIRRVHLEEDTGKLLHHDSTESGQPTSLVDFNRSGVPLLEIVTEPDMQSVDEVESYAKKLHTILRYLDVSSGDMEKGVIRFEANVSVREIGSDTLNTRTEIKNLNSFKALLRGVTYEVKRQSDIYAAGNTVKQQTLGWDEKRSETVPQRSKEHSHDYRYFPEPDLPPLKITPEWVDDIQSQIPELPDAKQARYEALGLNDYDAGVLAADRTVAEYFDQVLDAGSGSFPSVTAKSVANWITTQLFGLMNANGISIDEIRVIPAQLVELIDLVESGRINASSGKLVLSEMFENGKSATDIVKTKGLSQISDESLIAEVMRQVLDQNPKQVAQYLGGKESVGKWLFGQMMAKTGGKATPSVVQRVLDAALAEIKSDRDN